MIKRETMLLKALLAATVIACAHAICDREINRPVEWTGGVFDFPNNAMKSLYQASRRYIPKHGIATRAQIYKDDAFVALPRYKPGVPVTLARVSLKQKGCEAVLQPYPCWTAQEEGNCNALQNVVDLHIDPNELLWVLDVGVVNTLDNPVRKAPPKVVAFNLKTGRQVKKLDLSGLVCPASRLQYLAVEYTSTGRPYVYVSDAATRSILVFDIAGNKAFRVVLPKAVVGNGKRDVLYIALVRKGCGNNFLMMTYLSSPRVFTIRADYLRTGSTQGKIVDVGSKPKKMIVLGTDLGSAIFFRYEGEPDVYRWDANLCLSEPHLVKVYKSPHCYLATQVMADLRRQRMRVLESNFPDYLRNTVGCGANQMISLMDGCF